MRLTQNDPTLNGDNQHELMSLIAQAVKEADQKHRDKKKRKKKKKNKRHSPRRSSLFPGAARSPLSARHSVPQELYDDEERSWTRAGNNVVTVAL